MALTVRPDDEVYQFDTVWLGPDEYTLPIQARYVAWGTWLACFLVAAVLIIPIGGGGPAGVLGSLIWALGLSIVLSRAVMLIVDHERPLRSLPALFSAEARAAMHSRSRRERSLLVRPGRVTVRDTPPKVLAMRERQRSRAAAKAAKAERAATRRVDRRADRRRPVEPTIEVAAVEPATGLGRPAWTADSAVDGWHARRTPAWSIRADEHDVYEPAPVPVPLEDDEVREFVRAPDPETVTAPAPPPEPEPATPAEPAAAPAAPAAPMLTIMVEPAVTMPVTRGAKTASQPPVATTPAEIASHDDDGPVRTERRRAESHGEGRAIPAGDQVDPHAALERRLLLPARKDR